MPTLVTFTSSSISTFTDIVNVSFHFILKEAKVYIQKSYTFLFLIFFSSHLSTFLFLIVFSVDCLILFYSKESILSSAILIDKLNFFLTYIFCIGLYF